MLRIEHDFVRILLLTVSAAGIILFWLPMCVRIVNIGNVSGLCASVLLLVFVLFNGPISRCLGKLKQHTAGSVLLWVVGIILLLGVLYCLVMSCFMLHAAHKKPKAQPAAIIVLGCKVRGREPSLMLYRRIRAAYSAAQEYPDVPVIVSGGKGSNEGISEAACMENELLKMGLPAERIIQENRSASTSENLRFSKEIMDSRGIRGEVLIVTDSFHEFRASILAEIEGLPECSAAPTGTSWYLVPTYWVREWFGIAHAFVFKS